MGGWGWGGGGRGLGSGGGGRTDTCHDVAVTSRPLCLFLPLPTARPWEKKHRYLSITVDFPIATCWFTPSVQHSLPPPPPPLGAPPSPPTPTGTHTEGMGGGGWGGGGGGGGGVSSGGWGGGSEFGRGGLGSRAG